MILEELFARLDKNREKIVVDLKDAINALKTSNAEAVLIKDDIDTLVVKTRCKGYDHEEDFSLKINAEHLYIHSHDIRYIVNLLKRFTSLHSEQKTLLRKEMERFGIYKQPIELEECRVCGSNNITVDAEDIIDYFKELAKISNTRIEIIHVILGRTEDSLAHRLLLRHGCIVMLQ